MPRYFFLFHQIISDFEERTLNALKKVGDILLSCGKELGKFNRKTSSFSKFSDFISVINSNRIISASSFCLTGES